MCVTKLLSLRPRQHVSFFVQKRSFFSSVSAYRLQVSGDRKRIFSKRFPVWRFLETSASRSHVDRRKRWFIDYGDVRSRSIVSWMMSYIIYYACSVRNAIEITPFNCFRVRGRKRFKYATCGRVFSFPFKIGGIFGYV